MVQALAPGSYQTSADPEWSVLTSVHLSRIDPCPDSKWPVQSFSGYPQTEIVHKAFRRLFWRFLTGQWETNKSSWTQVASHWKGDIFYYFHRGVAETQKKIKEIETKPNQCTCTIVPGNHEYEGTISLFSCFNYWEISSKRASLITHGFRLDLLTLLAKTLPSSGLNSPALVVLCNCH